MQPNNVPTSGEKPFSIDSTPQINELTEALSIAQGEFPPIPKDTEVKVYSKPPNRTLLYTYLYADLTTIIDATRPALAKNGLSFTQDYFNHQAFGPGVSTILFHKSGQWIRTGFVPCPIMGMDMKQVASQMTYGKRISLTAALGISADEDADAASIEGQAGNSTERQPRQSQPPKDESTESRWDSLRTDKAPTKLEQMIALKNDKNIPNEAMPGIIKKATGIDKRSTELTDDQLDAVMKYLNLISGEGF